MNALFDDDDVFGIVRSDVHWERVAHADEHVIRQHIVEKRRGLEDNVTPVTCSVAQASPSLRFVSYSYR